MVEVKPETMPGVAEGAAPAVADGAKPAVHNDFNAKNPASSPFAEGERCLIPNENILYEGKILRIDFKEDEGGWRYFVHYVSFNKKYDDWLPCGSLKKYDEAATYAKAKSTVNGGQKRRRKRDAVDDDGDEIENMARIPLPSAVKTRLVQEWDMVTRDGMHVPLPKSITVDKLLDDFLKGVEGQGSFWGEITNGLKAYFDKTLRPMLLYPEENDQADALLGEGKVLPSAVYGGEHLLRLFVKLPDILPYTEMDEDSLETLTGRLSVILSDLKEKLANEEFFTDFTKYVKAPKPQA